MSDGVADTAISDKDLADASTKATQDASVTEEENKVESSAGGTKNKKKLKK